MIILDNYKKGNNSRYTYLYKIVLKDEYYEK